MGAGRPTSKDGCPVKSVTKWQDQSLIFELSSRSRVGDEKFKFNDKIKWRIDKNGDKLVEVTESTMTATNGIVIHLVRGHWCSHGAQSRYPF
jgi:hypothetical protein